MTASAHDNLIYFAMGFFCAFVVRWMVMQDFIATTPAETQKPETGESLNRLLASAEPTVSRQGNLLMLDCPDGTITDEIFNVLEAACYSSPNRSALAALEGGEQP